MKLKFDFFKLEDDGKIEASIENRHNTIIKVGTFLTSLKPFLTKDFKDKLLFIMIVQIKKRNRNSLIKELGMVKASNLKIIQQMIQ